jgi:hypothetical protein
MRIRLLLETVGLAAVCLSGSAQTPTQNAQTNTAIDSGWNRVQQLAAQTQVHIKADARKVTCSIDSVTENKLTCSSIKGKASTYQFSRAEIKSVLLPRRGKSAMYGSLLGAGGGAAAGAAIGSGINSGDTGSSLHVSGGKSAGVGAGVGAIVGGIAGIAIGHSADMFASTIYKR